MQIKATISLKKSDTNGRIPASILNEFVLSELLNKVSQSLRNELRIHQQTDPDAADNVLFSTEFTISHSGDMNG
ncbi:hypothetical protein [Arsenicibacter rosenii]|uniref:Uncharacterized protein n=1 Tax=Arsenicibacter rosenii TaxID=1750698 RepID=A0A1S2VB06_9BACT|nr:hypothetical protein [Arsenicibacter rosenii]OIN55600.1 hypothetical protein BLX24_29250 [Arsenicibacter rosenii]